MQRPHFVQARMLQNHNLRLQAPNNLKFWKLVFDNNFSSEHKFPNMPKNSNFFNANVRKVA